MITLAWSAPFFVMFEITQLLMAVRYIGVEQIRKGVHPLVADPRGPGILSAVWLMGILASYIYQFLLLLDPFIFAAASRITVPPAVMMIGVSVLGFALRRSLGLKWALVVMTFEGSMRAGFLAYVYIAVVIRPDLPGFRGPHWLG